MIKQRGCIAAPFAFKTPLRLLELVSRAEQEAPQARIGVTRVVARLEVVLATGVGVRRRRVEQVTNGKRELQVLAVEARVRRVQVVQGVVADVVRLERRVGRVFEGAG